MVSVNKLQTAFPRRALWALGTHPRCGPKGRHVRKTHFHFPAFPRVSLRELLDLCMIFCGGAGGTSPPPRGVAGLTHRGLFTAGPSLQTSPCDTRVILQYHFY